MRKACFFALVFLAILLSPSVFAKWFGNHACYRSGSYWYCARFDNGSFDSPCAGKVPAPHINAEVFRGSSDRLYDPALINWHLGWQQVNGKYCLIAYESKSKKCDKFCYESKTGKGSDILPALGLPDAMIRQSDISSVFQKLYIQPGSSPFAYITVLLGVAIAIFAVSVEALVRLIACIIAKVCT